MSDHAPSPGGLSTDSMFGRKMQEVNAEFDITAMIDLVFMMNIYFIVTFIAMALSEKDIPTAEHCEALDAETAMAVTVLQRPDGDSVFIYIGSDKDNEPLPKGDQEIKMLMAAVDQAVADGKTAVLFRLEKGVIVRELHRICSAIAAKGIELRMAVKEKDEGE